jgi:hypothetical protein
MDPLVQKEFDRLGKRSPWLARFQINGHLYGAGLNHDEDVRPPALFRLLPNPGRILELGSCQGGGTFQLARHPGVREIVAVEARASHVEKAHFVQRLLGVSKVTFLTADLETFDLTPLGRFDVAYCVGLLYHLPRPWELLTKLAAVTDTIYLNTHYCRPDQVNLTLQSYPGMKYQEGGVEEPLSGMSGWSFWPTLPALVRMLQAAGFNPEILETDTTGVGQAPHGTTILARRPAPSWLGRALARVKRSIVGRVLGRPTKQKS